MALEHSIDAAGNLFWVRMFVLFSYYPGQILEQSRIFGLILLQYKLKISADVGAAI